MLKDFFQITEHSIDDASNYRCQLMLNPQHRIYQGHFPEMPVLPGVCMLLIVRTCIEAQLQRSLQYQTIANCKFVATVRPDENPLLSLVYQIDSELNVRASLTQGDSVVLKLKANLKEV